MQDRIRTICKKAVMRRIMNSVNGLDRNCQVRTAGKLIHFVDLLVLHVTRSSPGLRLSMTQMTGIVGLNTTGSHQSVVPRSNCPGLGLHGRPQEHGEAGSSRVHRRSLWSEIHSTYYPCCQCRRKHGRDLRVSPKGTRQI